jgi:hypothetical protein
MRRRLVVRFALFVVALAALGCDAIEEFFGSWEGYVYPDRSDLTRSLYVGKFKTLEECRAAALQTIQVRSHPARADYECGLNCRLRDGLNICSRTER